MENHGKPKKTMEKSWETMGTSNLFHGKRHKLPRVSGGSSVAERLRGLVRIAVPQVRLGDLAGWVTFVLELGTDVWLGEL